MEDGPDLLCVKNSRWRVKNGDISFWRDPWLENGPLCDSYQVSDSPTVRVKDCKLDDGWDIDLSQRLLGIEKLEEVLFTLGRANIGDDILVWKGK